MSDFEANEHDPLEAALRQLRPAAPTFGTERLVFLAGQASGRCACWRLALLAALIGVGTGVVGTYVGVRAVMPTEMPPRVIVIRVPAAAPDAPSEKPPPPSSPPVVDQSPSLAWESLFQFARPANGYLQMRDRALRLGIEAMPNDAPSAAVGVVPRSMTVLEMQSEMVGKASEF